MCQHTGQSSCRYQEKTTPLADNQLGYSLPMDSRPPSFQTFALFPHHVCNKAASYTFRRRGRDNLGAGLRRIVCFFIAWEFLHSVLRSILLISSRVNQFLEGQKLPCCCVDIELAGSKNRHVVSARLTANSQGNENHDHERVGLAVCLYFPGRRYVDLVGQPQPGICQQVHVR